jgi:V/A-type H+/Na+-transporting ATPase subunit K
MDFSMVGPAMVLGLACIGSSIGCTIGGMASHGVMTHVEEGHGKFIGLSALPSSQCIYSLVLMVLMAGKLRDGTLSPLSAMGIGFFFGL